MTEHERAATPQATTTSQGTPSAAARPYSPVLDAIRITATVAVVAVHVLAPSMSQDSPTPLLALRSVLATAVPVFIMISGALNLSPQALRGGSSRFLGRRLRRLLPATVFWTAFYILVLKVLVLPSPYPLTKIVTDLLTASSYAHLYFLPLIIGLTVVTPILATYIGESGRRAWICGALAAVWSLLVIALPFVSSGLLGTSVRTVDLSVLTYFLPYVGYYVLGRAVWLAPPGRRLALTLLVLAVPVLIGATIWAYSSTWTQQVPGQVFLPTYLSPLVVLLTAALTSGVIGTARGWTVSARTGSRMRALGAATFGVYLMHLALLTPLQLLGVRGESVLSAVGLILGITAVSFALTLSARRIPGVRAVI